MTYDQISIEGFVESRQRLGQIGAANVGGVIPHARVNDEKRHDAPLCTGRLNESRVVLKAQVSAEPHNGGHS
jgi:hypothetical protein